MTPIYFKGVEYTNIPLTDPLLGLSGTQWGSKRDPVAQKQVLLGEKLLSAPGHPGNVQNIMEYPV